MPHERSRRDYSMRKMPELPSAATPRLLLIEDDVRLCRLVKDYLENMGYSVSMEHSGPAGLAAAMRDTFQAIILDVMLPGMEASRCCAACGFIRPCRC